MWWRINGSVKLRAPFLKWPIMVTKGPQIAKFMGPTWGPPVSCRLKMGPMLVLWTLLSGSVQVICHKTLTVSLYNSNGRQIARDYVFLKTVGIPFGGVNMHCCLPRVHWVCRYPHSSFRLANHSNDDASRWQAIYSIPVTVVQPSGKDCAAV